MELIIYKEFYKIEDSIDNFCTLYYNLQMDFLASDLLDEGLSPQQITDGVLRAMKVGAASNMEIRKHFMPVFTQLKNGIISDCKLSKLGYGMVLLNASPDLPSVGKWQIKVLEKYFY